MIPKRPRAINHSCCQSDVQKEGNWFRFPSSSMSLSRCNSMEWESFQCFGRKMHWKKHKETLAWRIKLKLSGVGGCPNYFFNSQYCQTCLSCTRCSRKQRLRYFLLIYLFADCWCWVCHPLLLHPLPVSPARQSLLNYFTPVTLQEMH